ncbi:MAG: 23S rRNA pseudouridine2605 synthase, partial [Cognaticolwellia sp.]
MSEKLQKVLARAGAGSRREMETYISAGRVSVEGKTAYLGDRVEGNELIRVDGHQIKLKALEEDFCRVLMYNKPEGEMCTRKDPEGR